METLLILYALTGCAISPERPVNYDTPALCEAGGAAQVAARDDAVRWECTEPRDVAPRVQWDDGRLAVGE